MARGNDMAKEVEWRIKVEEDDDTLQKTIVGCMWAVTAGLALKLCKFVKKAWEVGVNDPRKFIHCLKVGIALSAVSLFYYWKPLYDGVGGNAMWAVMTVVVVFEYTAGATICKTVNRMCGTSLAGFLGIGVHWVASRAGEQWEPVIAGVSIVKLIDAHVFVSSASAATFSRFIPSLKARFDYGILIFILTFSLVSISGYRVDELLVMAQYRVCTIIIGSIMCIIVSVIIRPIWAGFELFVLVTGNLDKLANSLRCCVVQYFGGSEASEAESDEVSDKKLLGYKCVLSSKATEETMANFARWEPAHGRFNFRHPWRQYVKIGASMRSCASCLDALIGCINSDNQASDDMKKNMSSISMKVGANCASVIRELATTIRKMKKSSKLDILVTQMNSAAQELRSLLNSCPNLVNPLHNSKRSTRTETASPDDLAPKIEIPLMEIIQVVTVASLLIEIVARVEDIVENVEELSDLANFQPEMNVKSKQHTSDSKVSPDQQNDGEPVRTLQMV
ncbi:Aluminum-activated malate transporter 10 [Glycine soja]